MPIAIYVGPVYQLRNTLAEIRSLNNGWLQARLAEDVVLDEARGMDNYYAGVWYNWMAQNWRPVRRAVYVGPGSSTPNAIVYDHPVLPRMYYNVMREGHTNWTPYLKTDWHLLQDDLV